MAENKSFTVLAVGHYGAEQAAVTVGLRSDNPQKQLIELDCLEQALEDAFRKERARILYEIEAAKVAANA